MVAALQGNLLAPLSCSKVVDCLQFLIMAKDFSYLSCLQLNKILSDNNPNSLSAQSQDYVLEYKSNKHKIPISFYWLLGKVFLFCLDFLAMQHGVQALTFGLCDNSKHFSVTLQYVIIKRQSRIYIFALTVIKPYMITGLDCCFLVSRAS